MRVCLVASGLSEQHRCLQPWRYLIGAAHTLAHRGHEVMLLTDRASAVAAHGRLQGLALLPCRGTRWPTPSTLQLARTQKADVVLWHVGRTTFLVPPWSVPIQKDAPPVVAVWTSPIYRPHELLRLGCSTLCRSLPLAAAHLLGLLARGGVISQALRTGRLSALVVECEHTRARLCALGVEAQRIHVLRPAIDPLWFQSSLDPKERRMVRCAMGYEDDELLVGTFGPAEPLRGLPDLLSALTVARDEQPNLRLLAFCRSQRDGNADGYALAGQGAARGAEGWARFVRGWVEPAALARCLAACDLIALPFRLVPSDVPLSVLEAMALGQPVVVTNVSCLPELVPRGSGLAVPPAAPDALAEAIAFLARSQGLRKYLGAAARARAARWQSEHEEARWEHLLELASAPTSSTWQARTGQERAPRQVY